MGGGGGGGRVGLFVCLSYCVGVVCLLALFCLFWFGGFVCLFACLFVCSLVLFVCFSLGGGVLICLITESALTSKGTFLNSKNLMEAL